MPDLSYNGSKESLESESVDTRTAIQTFMVAISTIPVSPDAAFLRLFNVPNPLPQLLQDKRLQEEFWQARIPP